jgi:hypothetical protein
MQDSGAVGEFLEETWGILDSLSEACAAGKAPAVFKDGVKTIERNLHTIKGNAAAFGFQDLSEAASRTLDWLRASMRVTGNTLERPEDIPPVLDFTGKLRQYLALLNPQEASPKGFWDETLAPPPAPSARKASPAAPKRNPQQSPGAEPDWNAEAKRILAEAPVINPKIDAIVWMAIQKLTGKAGPGPPGQPAAETAARPPPPVALLKTELVVPPPVERPGAAPAPPPDRAKKTDETHRPPCVAGVSPIGAQVSVEARAFSASSVHAYALEAMVKAAWLRRLQEKCQVNGWLEAAFSEVSDVLVSFARWSKETRSAPLSSFIGSSPAPAKRKAAAHGSKPALELSNHEIRVLPALGKLIQVLLDEVLRACPPSQRSGETVHPPVKVCAAYDGGLFKLTASSIHGLDRATGRLHLDLLRQRVERCGVSVARSAEADGGSNLLISAPEHLDGMEVLVVQAGDDRIGLPWHRVHAVLERGDLERSVRLEHGWLEIDGDRFPLLDLAGESSSGAPVGGVIVLRTDKGRRGLRVDKVFRQEEMIVTAPDQGALPNEAFGQCLAFEGLEWMPFLWCSSRLFEQQECLAHRT